MLALACYFCSMSGAFRFKHFSVEHANAPFRVGTDAVLLGSWASVVPDQIMADAGTGTGVIACMLAQRGAKKVIGIEADAIAQPWARMNFENFLLPHPPQLLESRIEDIGWKGEIRGVACNPPFFINATPNPDNRKLMARHADIDLPSRWIHAFSNWLDPLGFISLILPAEIVDYWEKVLQTDGFYCRRLCEVHSFPGGPVIRILSEWHRTPGPLFRENLTLYNSDRRTRSEEYARLTEDFYL